jgi:ABC-type glucose/galactose transport system permease subunit
MSNAVKAVIGVVAILVAPYASPWLVPILYGAGTSLLINAAASLFIHAPRATPLAGVAINYSGTLEPRRILYGTMKIGGMNALPPITSGPCHDLGDVALALGC